MIQLWVWQEKHELYKKKNRLNRAWNIRFILLILGTQVNIKSEVTEVKGARADLENML